MINLGIVFWIKLDAKTVETLNVFFLQKHDFFIDCCLNFMLLLVVCLINLLKYNKNYCFFWSM